MPYILKSCYWNDWPNIGSVNLTQHIYLPRMSNLCDIKWICSSDFHGRLDLTGLSRLRFWWSSILDLELENLGEVLRVEMISMLAYFLFRFRELYQSVMQQILNSLFIFAKTIDSAS